MKKLKKILHTAVLSAGLLASCTTLNKKDIDLSYLENTAMIVQNSALCYEDEYTYTKPAIEKFGFQEMNLIAKSFQKNNQWDLYYAGSIGAIILGNYLAYQIDKTGNLAKLINGGIALMETWVIQNNSKILTSAGWKENSSNVNRYIEIFRQDY